jgi:glycosyltransferase involved in cell wall biosynthesis
MLIGQDAYQCKIKLIARAKVLGVDDKIEFKGRVDHLEAMALISKASIGLCLLRPHPNYLKSLSTKILEYMMGQTAVLASNFDCWVPYVIGEKAGMMVDPDNIEEISDVCMQMLSDRQALKLMGENGLKAVQDKYNWDSEFKQLLCCYDSFAK